MKIKLSVPMYLSEISDAVNGRLNVSDVLIEYICTDTRELSGGELFFALSGEKFDGNSFTEAARDREAYTVGKSDGDSIFVPDGGEALLSLAKYYKTKLTKLKATVAITGSIGKTTTKEFLFETARVFFATHKNHGNFNNCIGMPLTLLSAPRDTELLILEMGMNKRGEISAMSKCAEPDIAIITNIGSAHIGNLGSREEIARAKLEILDGLRGIPILPSGEPLLSHINGIHFSVNTSDGDISVIAEPNKKISVHIGEQTLLDIPFFSSEYRDLACLAPAIAALSVLGIKAKAVGSSIYLISGENTRQKLISVANRTVISDFYNASPESFKEAIRSLSMTNNYAARSVLIGDMLELGEYSEELHRELGAFAASRHIDRIFTFGECSQAVTNGALSKGFPSDRIHINPDTSKPQTTAEQILEYTLEGEIILFKASRGMKLELILEELRRSDEF